MNNIIEKTVVFDLEIKNVIDGKNITWNDKDKMGISVGVARVGDDYKVFMDDNLNELVELLEGAEMVSGFNIIGFDIPLLEATIGRKLKLSVVYDMLEISRMAVGWSPGKPYSKYPIGLKLNDHLSEMFGDQKTEDGADAPLFWQQGKLGRLISYCVSDVQKEWRLFEHMHFHGYVRTKTHGEQKVITPSEWFRGLYVQL
jgi:predicted PolB exonuclease-like 3'-5' exonuclease